MKIWHIIIVLVLIGAVSLTFNGLIVDVNEGLSANLNNSRLTAFDTTYTTSTLSETLKNESTVGTAESTEDALFGPIKIASGVYQAMKSMIPSIEGLLTAAQQDLSVPAFIIGIVITIVIIVIVWKAIEFWKE
jgi:hypothetical protein